MKVNIPKIDTSYPYKFIQDIPAFFDNFRLTNWLEVGKSFVMKQVITEFKRVHPDTGKRYKVKAIPRKPQGLQDNVDFIAQLIYRINNIETIANVEMLVLWDYEKYDGNLEVNPQYIALYMNYVDMPEEDVPDNYADCKELLFN